MFSIFQIFLDYDIVLNISFTWTPTIFHPCFELIKRDQIEAHIRERLCKYVGKREKTNRGQPIFVILSNGDTTSHLSPYSIWVVGRAGSNVFFFPIFFHHFYASNTFVVAFIILGILLSRQTN